MKRIYLCTIAELQDTQCKEVVLKNTSPPLELFLVRHNEEFVAYLNHCPHTGINLNWQPNQFLDISGQFIQCSTHGALFRLHNGECIRGPCIGQSLKALTLSYDKNAIYLEF